MKADKQFYEKYANTYPDDLVVRGSQLAKIKALLNYRNKVGLDIGSANGAFTIELAKSGAKKMYGIDIADEFIKKSTARLKKEKLKNVTFLQADANKLPFQDNSFDFIICTEVLEHVPGFRKAIAEIKRVLKPGGIFVITTPNSFNPAEILHQIKHVIFYVTKKEPITHINLFFIPTFHSYFSWAKNKKTDSLHFVLPFFPKKFVNHPLITLDLAIGQLLKLVSFDIVLTGKK